MTNEQIRIKVAEALGSHEPHNYPDDNETYLLRRQAAWERRCEKEREIERWEVGFDPVETRNDDEESEDEND